MKYLKKNSKMILILSIKTEIKVRDGFFRLSLFRGNKEENNEKFFNLAIGFIYGNILDNKNDSSSYI